MRSRAPTTSSPTDYIGATPPQAGGELAVVVDLGAPGTLNGKTGHLTKIIDNLNINKNREYEFDAVGRLTKMKGGPTGNLSTQTYVYDRYGNRTSVTATGVAADNSTMPTDGIPNLAYNTTNNRITTAGFQFDVAGNQTRALAEDGVTWLKYEYDAANRIQFVKRDDGTALQAFQYGSTNARLMDTDYGLALTRMFASVGGTVLAEYTEFSYLVLTWTKGFTYMGDSLLSTLTPNGSGGETIEFDHPDRLGTRLKTNQASGTSSEQAHLPFGRPLNAESTLTNNARRFTSYERSSATGLDYAINRTYDSKQGRFTQVDPIGMRSVDITAPQTLNLYSYCANDPINQVDPSGLGFLSFLKKLFKVISKVLKWVAVVVLVAIVILAGPFAPAAGTLLAKILGGIAWFGAKIGMGMNFLAGGGLLAEGATQLAAAALGAFGLFATGATAGIISRALPDPCPPNCEKVIKLPGESVTVVIGAAGGWIKLLQTLGQIVGAIGRWLARVLPRIWNGLIAGAQKVLEGIKAGANVGWKLAKFGVDKVKNIFRSNPKITFKTDHAARADHFPDGVDVAKVEGAIRQSVNSVVRSSNITGEWWGRVKVNGTIIEYRAFTLPNGTINIGTYYPPPIP